MLGRDGKINELATRQSQTRGKIQEVMGSDWRHVWEGTIRDRCAHDGGKGQDTNLKQRQG